MMRANPGSLYTVVRAASPGVKHSVVCAGALAPLVKARGFGMTPLGDVQGLLNPWRKV